jgi:hypothetical protein
VAQYVSKKVSDLFAFIFFGILHGYVSKTYPTSIGIGYVSRYPIRYGLKYPCFIATPTTAGLILNQDIYNTIQHLPRVSSQI